MRWLLTAITTGTLAFAATNIDDIFILTLFFAQAGKKGGGRWRIVAGQYLGFIALVAISFTGYFARFVVPREWIGLLGLVPVAMGVKKLVEWKRAEDHSSVEKPAGATVLTVAAVTFANGGDNIGIYAPLFASSEAAQSGVMLGVFFVLIAVWCALGYYLGNRPTVTKVLDCYGPIIVPFVLIGLGIYILYESATFHLIPGLGGQ